MIKSLKGFGWNNIGPASHMVAQHDISVGPMYRVIWVVAFLATGWESVTCIEMSQRTRDNLPMLFYCWASVRDCGSTLKQHQVNAMCLLMHWRKVYSRPSVGLLLGKRRRRFTSIEPAMGCDAGPTLNRNWVCRPTSSVRGIS